MRLGFTVPELLRAGRGGGALRMGLRRVAEVDWLWPDFDRVARAAAFDAHPEAVREQPGAADAVHELAAFLGIDGGLAQIARAHWEDICILQSDEEGAPYQLTAAAVAFPTDWRLDEKMGQGLTAIHAPIHGYAEQLAAGVDHFFNILPPGDIFGRANWFIVADSAWRYLPEDDPATRFAHVTAANAGETLFVRCERQTLRRLPKTRAMIFTIGVALAPLGTLAPDLVRRLADALPALPEGEQQRRHVVGYAAPLRAYADGLTRHAA
ncbi:MAG: hypothetical protein BGP16_16495 [Sphingobium sp. 66-54]|nr:MAG: hypothetical protein BGP16_16495 [Sphingobium sp. 66-54]